MRLRMSLSKPSIMRLPDIVLTTVFSDALLDGYPIHARMIAANIEIRYEVLYFRQVATAACLPALLHGLLVLGVDVLDVLPDEALGVLEVLATLTQDVCRVEGRQRLYAALQVVPLATILGDPEVLIYDGLGRRTAEAEYDLRLYRLRLPLQVDVAGFDLTRPRLAVFHAPALFDRRPALDDVGEVDVLTGEVYRRQNVVEQLARPPDEGQPRGVLVLPGPLANKHERRVGVARAEDGVGAAEGQVAPGAHRHLPGELNQALFPVLAAFGGVKKIVQNSSSAILATPVHSTPVPPVPALDRIAWSAT